MNKTARHILKRILLILFPAVFSFCSLPAEASTQSTYTGHDNVSVSSAVSIIEDEPVRFGNLTVSSPGGSDASIVLSDSGARTVYQGASTMITPLYGANNGGNTATGAQGPGHYRVTSAGNCTKLYVYFTDLTGAAITSTNPIVLSGPPGSNVFNVDTLTFNSTGTDGTGPFKLTDSAGNADIRVGATLHTAACSSPCPPYTPGTYRGAFEVMISY